METVFSKAADVLRKHGWTQQRYVDVDLGYCLMGALGAVAKDDQTVSICGVVAPIPSPQYFVAKEKIREFLGLPSKLFSIETWNDAPSRTREDVLDLLQEMHEKELAERGELA